MTLDEFYHKVDWEGGVEAVLDYGLRADRIEDGELKDVWSKLEKIYDQEFRTLVNRFYELEAEYYAKDRDDGAYL